MRRFLLFLGWSSVVGSVFDGGLVLYALWQTLVSGAAELWISFDAFLTRFVSVIYWVKQVAYYPMPPGFVTWLFAIPALVYFRFALSRACCPAGGPLKAAAELADTERHGKSVSAATCHKP